MDLDYNRDGRISMETADVQHDRVDSTIFPPGATLPIVGVYFTALYRALAFSRTRLLDHI